VIRALAAVVLLVAGHPFHASVQPLPASLRGELTGTYWHQGCPVSLSDLRVLTLSYWDFEGRPQTGQLVVNEQATGPLTKAFRRLYALRFPIHYMQLANIYGPRRDWAPDGDVTASFECRQASASPCTGTNGTTGSWSEHAYGEAVDVNPVENPYVGCGMTRDKTAISYMDRSRLRKGMVTPAVVAAFADAGWGWGGSWSGSTKDYMHFSATGH
jgi:hypothetical protein